MQSGFVDLGADVQRLDLQLRVRLGAAGLQRFDVPEHRRVRDVRGVDAALRGLRERMRRLDGYPFLQRNEVQLHLPRKPR
jgi:hypothetical protein